MAHTRAMHCYMSMGSWFDAYGSEVIAQKYADNGSLFLRYFCVCGGQARAFCNHDIVLVFVMIHMRSSGRAGFLQSHP